jgi:hypothetical protein
MTEFVVRLRQNSLKKAAVERVGFSGRNWTLVSAVEHF